MARIIAPRNKQKKKRGSIDGMDTHTNSETSNPVTITLIRYNENYFDEQILKKVDLTTRLQLEGSITWIVVEGLHSIETIKTITEILKLHPLTLKDVLSSGQRPKFEDFSHYLYVNLNILAPEKGEDSVRVNYMSIILGKNFVVTCSEYPIGPFLHLRERIKKDYRIRIHGTDYLAYTLIDCIIDDYFNVIEFLGDKIENLEDELAFSSHSETLPKINLLKKEMITIRRSIWPLREVISNFERSESVILNAGTVIYLKDVYDHIVQIMDTLEIYRDMSGSMLDIYLSSMSYQLNEVMKVLTIIATIFIPLTFVVGIYGMNFEYMPELTWVYGYPAVLIVMSGIACIMLYYFRTKRWI